MEASSSSRERSPHHVPRHGPPILYQMFSHAEYVPDEWHDNTQVERYPNEDVRNESRWYRGPNLIGLKKWIQKRLQFKGSDAAIVQALPSLSGGHVAILHYDTVTILSREDHFRKVIGIFNEVLEAEHFVLGEWIDDFDIFAVASSLKVIYLLNSSAELLSKVSLREHRLKGDLVGMFTQKAHDESAGDYKYELLLITSKSTLHRIGINHKKLELSNYNGKVEVQCDVRTRHPYGVLCACFNKEQSILVIVGPSKVNRRLGFSGEFCFSVWKATNFPSLHLLFCSSPVEGYSKFSWSWPTKFPANGSRPKVVISPDTQFMAFLDVQGKLHLLQIRDGAKYVLKDFPLSFSATQPFFQESNALVDMEWWSGDALTCASLTKAVNIFHVPGLFGLLDPIPTFASSCLHITKNIFGRFFVLEELKERHIREPYSTSSDSEQNTSASNRLIDRLLTPPYLNHKSGWRLVSLVQHSASELLQILIEDGEYESALSLAKQYDLDTDEIYKCRWKRSDFGIDAIEQNLSAVKDRRWVVSECLERLSLDVESMGALLLYGLDETDPYSNDESEQSVGAAVHIKNLWWFRLKRLRLLQYKDRLDTFVGMHMGRYFPAEYSTFRTADLQKIAVGFAEGGKTRALGLLFKRHTLSLAPSILTILDAIPETLPPHSFSHLLPEIHPPKVSIPRPHGDWVENDCTLQAIMDGLPGIEEQHLEVHLSECTEHMVKLYKGLIWPNETEISGWYCKRAREIDRLSGQLENSLTLLDLGLSKGLKELQHVWENVTDLYKVSFASIDTESAEVECSFSNWERLSSYEKFKMMLSGVNEGNVVDRLRDLAVPFLHKNHVVTPFSVTEGSKEETFSGTLDSSDSFIGNWLKELASENKLGICAVVLEEACRVEGRNWLFRDEVEIIETSIDCIYLCTQTNEWSLMERILSRLPSRRRRESTLVPMHEDTNNEMGFRKGLVKAFRRPSSQKAASKLSATASLAAEEKQEMAAPSLKFDSQVVLIPEMVDKRVKQTDGHVEAGQLLSFYRVPRPINYFLSSQQEAFPFLHKEYLLSELCRGLLKAEKFSLARSYLKGTGSDVLAKDKAEKLVIQAAHDFFYSASSLDSPDIEKARECLDLLPESNLLTSEANLIEVITVRLPDLGVTLLPLQFFRQVNDPMEVVKMAISTQSSSFLRVEEIKEVARLLGLTSQDDLAVVEAAIAREAAAAGNFEIATGLCLGLLKKAYGPIWDLCAAIGRGPSSEHLDLKSRKELLGFALEHCDEDSVGELLTAWKEIDLISQCKQLGLMVCKPVPSLEDHESFIDAISTSEAVTRLEYLKSDRSLHDCEKNKQMWQPAKDSFLTVTRRESNLNEQNWRLFSRQTKNFLGFICLQLPWLVELVLKGKEGQLCADSRGEGKACYLVLRDSGLTKECSISDAQAAAVILYGLASHDIASSDDLVLILAQKLLEKPTTSQDDFLGCGYFLNLVDARIGAHTLEQAFKERKDFREAKEGIKVAIAYSTLYKIASELRPEKRRQFLYNTLRGRKFSVPESSKEEMEMEIDFWTTWRLTYESKLQLMEQMRILEQMIPGVEIGRFISGDEDYIKDMVYLLVESVKPEEPDQLIRTLALAEAYRVDKWQVLLHSFGNQSKQTLESLKEKYRICHDYFHDRSPFDLENFLHTFLQASMLSSDMGNVEYVEAPSNLDPVVNEECKLSTMSSLLLIWIQAFTDVLKYLNQGQNISEQQKHRMLIERNVRETAICCMAFQRLLMEKNLTWKQCWTVLTKTAETEFFSQTASASHSILKVMASCGCSLKSLLVTVNFFIENGANVVVLSEDSASSKDLSIDSTSYLSDSINLRLSVMQEDLLSRSNDGKPTTSNNLKQLYIQFLYKDLVKAVLEEMTFLSADFEVKINPLLGVLTSLSSRGSEYSGEIASMQLNEKHSHFDLLQTVRHGVWKQLCNYAEESKAPFETRVRILELLDITMGMLEDVQSLSYSSVDQPILWDGWGSTLQKTKPIMQISGQVCMIEENEQVRVDVYKSRCTLTAMKTNHIMSKYWPGKEVKAEYFANLEELVIFFESLVISTSSIAHAVALLSILKEWDRIITAHQNCSDGNLQTADKEEDSWGGVEEWGEGWEELEETQEEYLTKADGKIILHRLHQCWSLALHKIVQLGGLKEAMEALDLTLVTSYVVLTEDELKSLVTSIGEDDPISALKIALLFPYATSQNLGLDLVKKHLDHQQPSLSHQGESAGTKYGQQIRGDASTNDVMLLILILASRRLPSLAGDMEYIKIFAGLCMVLASLTQYFEQDYEARLAVDNVAESSGVFCEKELAIITLPFFVAELTQAKHYGLAGTLVLQYVRVHPALATWNTVPIALKKYLEVQVLLEDERRKSNAPICVLYKDSFALPQTMQRLTSLLPKLLNSALRILSNDMD
ncbi:hypothetical protein O6H91_02G056800 [Diphasiastrum complanatum]|uniref:Uncharacterized protein n=1 Tax=Diphasiastrum complanatum TaxID=34168 RepID=A0ACC2EFM7_DIPCM|nr:hypothetical protein O6H91_02G056800 [Diphasiastrum complanatum]